MIEEHTAPCSENKFGIVPSGMLREVSFHFAATPDKAMHDLISGLVSSHVNSFSFHCETAEIIEALSKDFRLLKQSRISFEILSAFAISGQLAENHVFIVSDIDSLSDNMEKSNFRQIEIQYTGGAVESFRELIHFCKKKAIPFRFGCTNEFITASPEIWAKLASEGISLTGDNACSKYRNSCYIESDGTVYPCKCCKLAMGNIYNTSLKEILEFSNVFDFFHRITQKVKEPCKSCPSCNFCAGCRGRAWSFSGDFLAPDPGCSKIDKGQINCLPYRHPEKCLPHRSPMLLAETLLKIEDCKNYAEYTIPENNIFLQADGSLHPAALIEIAAQSMGYLDTFLHPGEKLNGGLVEIEKFSYGQSPLFSGDKLYIENEKIYEMPPWHIAGFKIFKAGEGKKLVAEGEFKLCHFDTV